MLRCQKLGHQWRFPNFSISHHADPHLVLVAVHVHVHHDGAHPGRGGGGVAQHWWNTGAGVEACVTGQGSGPGSAAFNGVTQLYNPTLLDWEGPESVKLLGQPGVVASSWKTADPGLIVRWLLKWKKNNYEYCVNMTIYPEAPEN